MWLKYGGADEKPCSLHLLYTLWSYVPEIFSQGYVYIVREEFKMTEVIARYLALLTLKNKASCKVEIELWGAPRL